MSLPTEVAPLVAAINAGIPVGKMQPGQPCPEIPPMPMIVLVDDAKGEGPEAFDTTNLFSQIDSVVFAVPLTFRDGAAAVAVAAGKGDRTLLVQTPSETLARWLAMVIGHPKLMREYCVLGVGEVSPEIRELVKDIDQLKTTKLN
jgi:hypothetical protein